MARAFFEGGGRGGEESFAPMERRAKVGDVIRADIRENLERTRAKRGGLGDGEDRQWNQRVISRLEADGLGEHMGMINTDGSFWGNVLKMS